jgi:hypothetical protein
MAPRLYFVRSICVKICEVLVGLTGLVSISSPRVTICIASFPFTASPPAPDLRATHSGGDSDHCAGDAQRQGGAGHPGRHPQGGDLRERGRRGHQSAVLEETTWLVVLMVMQEEHKACFMV